jgi:hypothetical protein
VTRSNQRKPSNPHVGRRGSEERFRRGMRCCRAKGATRLAERERARRASASPQSGGTALFLHLPAGMLRHPLFLSAGPDARQCLRARASRSTRRCGRLGGG